MESFNFRHGCVTVRPLSASTVWLALRKNVFIFHAYALKCLRDFNILFYCIVKTMFAEHLFGTGLLARAVEA